MAKTSPGTPRRPEPQQATGRRRQVHRIAEMIDLASDAKRIADAVGEAFLSYLLAITILEMQTIRDTQATSVPGPIAKQPRSTRPVDPS